MNHEEHSIGRRLENIESDLRGLRKQLDRRKPAKLMRSMRYELVDARGRTRAVLEMDEDGGPVLDLLDEKGNSRGKLRLAGAGAPSEAKKAEEVDAAPRREPAPDVEPKEHAGDVRGRDRETAEQAAPEELQPSPRASLEERIEALRPWLHPVRVGRIKVLPGVGSTMKADVIQNQTRCRSTLLVDAVVDRYRIEGKSVLDVGCGCGYWSARYVEKGAGRVLGVEGRDAFCRQAELYFEESAILPPADYRFIPGNVADPVVWARVREMGTFDIALCAGILHHIPNYREVLEQVAGMTRDVIVVDTRVGAESETPIEEPGDLWFNAIEETRTKVVPHLGRLRECLESLGFEAEVLPVSFASGPGVQHADDYSTARRVAIFAKKS